MAGGIDGVGRAARLSAIPRSRDRAMAQLAPGALEQGHDRAHEAMSGGWLAGQSRIGSASVAARS
ncbi:MAG: hypothetical protein CVU38_02925 [Chloroflexi bacterium HGW-Chloroflexi-1]|nr:MAG: hypothetical protein CVU38_02925 [Chloroflexi bacterium HGW-Chloroflexi-1]